MNERQVLQSRRDTLAGLLDAPNGPLGPNAGVLGERIRQSWEAEMRLLDRILTDTPGDDVRATIAAWRSRTAAFVTRSPANRSSWTDKQGVEWDAPMVLGILDDLAERVERWSYAGSSDGATTGGGSR